MMNMVSPIKENPFLPGRLYMSDDPSSIIDALSHGIPVIAAIDVSEQNDPRYNGCVVLSGLLPPSTVITEMIDGSKEKGISMYLQYLSNKDREQTITTILAALQKRNWNFLIYTEYDSNKEFCILQTLSIFLRDLFGINMGVYKNPNYPAFNIDKPEYQFNISTLLLSNGFINVHTFADMMPANVPPDLRVYPILLRDLNIKFESPECAKRACMAIINDLKQEHQTKRINPIIFF